MKVKYNDIEVRIQNRIVFTKSNPISHACEDVCNFYHILIDIIRNDKALYDMKCSTKVAFYLHNKVSELYIGKEVNIDDISVIVESSDWNMFFIDSKMQNEARLDNEVVVMEEMFPYRYFQEDGGFIQVIIALRKEYVFGLDIKI